MSIETTSDTTAKDDAKDLFKLPNGDMIRYIPAKEGAYTIELLDKNEKFLGAMCSCLGVCIPCPAGKSPDCDCAKSPPVLKCV